MLKYRNSTLLLVLWNTFYKLAIGDEKWYALSFIFQDDNRQTFETKPGVSKNGCVGCLVLVKKQRKWKPKLFENCQLTVTEPLR